MSDPNAWKCDECRIHRLESKRRCGFIPESEKEPHRVVWIRGNVSTEECPKSYINSQSLYFIDRFFSWLTFQHLDIQKLSAKEADALIILDSQWKAEKENATVQCAK